MELRIIDAHTHAHFRGFDADRDEVVARALDAGIGMVNVGTDKKTSAEAIALAEKYDGLALSGAERVWATVGLHPIHTAPSFHDEDEGVDDPETEFDYEYYLSLAKHPKVVAIGECGLDYAAFARERSERLQKRASAEAPGGGGLSEEEIEIRKQLQKKVFVAQIQLAAEVEKPLMLHCRSAGFTLSAVEGPGNAYRDMINTLKTNNSKLKTDVSGISHFFSGTIEEAKELLELGFYFTFGGAITLPKKSDGADFEALVKFMPKERILVETDAPYVAPLSHRGRRNEPAYITEVIEKLAELRGVSIEEMERITLENTKRIFNLIV